MKPIHDYGSTEQSCSCTSCLYRSESDRPSLRRFVAHGSRIDKLYYGKYLPLRERKLLERLVRTRAVYDDMRRQILSDSSVSFSKPALETRARKLSKDKGLDGIERSSDIIAMVDLVDKGAALPLNNLSECCSCCICGSNMNTDGTPKRRSHIHEHEPRYEWRHAYNRGYSRAKRRISKVMATSKYKLGQISEFNKNVRFRTKRVRSEPCTCTYKFSELLKKSSSVMKKRLHRDNPQEELKPTSSPEQYKPKLLDTENDTRQSLQKIKHSRTCLCKKIEGASKRSTTIVKKSATKLKTVLKTVAKKSVEGLKDVKYIAREKSEPPQRKRKIEPLVAGDVDKNERNIFTIKKDSLTKFREQLRLRHELNDWKCDFECYPDECNPEECFRIRKRNKKHNITDKRFHDSNKFDKKVGEPSLNSDMSVQVDKIQNVRKPIKKKHDTKNTQADKNIGLVAPGVNVDIKKRVNINKNKIKTRINKTEHASPVPKIKSRTNLPRMRSKLLTKSVSSNDISRITNAEQNNNMSSIKRQDLVRDKRRDVKLVRKEVPVEINRQIVRVGSSFSFNIEFYKDKPSQKRPEVNISEIITQKKKSKIPFKKEPNTINIKQKYKSRKIRHHNKKSGSLHTNTQPGEHPLKRCLCTLQLKAKKTKMYVNKLHKQESVQTNKLYTAHPILLPYECEPNICVPGNCNPAVCNKIIRKRNTKHRYASTNSTFGTKTISSSTTSKSVAGITPKSIQVHAARKPENMMLFTTPVAANVTANNKPPKQAVRIGSAFSFNIEFSKEHSSGTHNNTDVKNFTTPVNKSFENRKLKKKMDKTKRYIRHKHSQISNSIGKSRHTTTKYNLRRCFCTAKIGGLEKKKRIKSISKSTVTSSQNIVRAPKLYPVLKTAGVGTGKERNKIINLRLLPYQCEPDVCVPGECNPYICQKMLYAREPKRLKGHSRKSNTESRKTRSTSSFTSRSDKLNKTKKVQSAFVAYPGKVPNYIPKQTVTTSQLVNKLQSNNNFSRQAVRIGSNFSFNIEFYKEKPNDVVSDFTQRFDHKVTPVVNIRQIPKTIKHENKIGIKDHRIQGIERKRKSIQMQVEQKRKSIQIGTAMKRCFCTLNIHKKSKNKTYNVINTGTKTPHFNVKTQPHVSSVLQNTMTNVDYKYIRHFDQFECEPGVCIPGECDPYKCLEKIKRRDCIRYSREMGVLAKPANLRSTSSSMQNIRPKDVFIQSNIVEQKTSIKKIKRRKVSSQLNPPDKLHNINAEKSRQAVNIGSKFNFDIEFYKSAPQEQLKMIQKKLKDRAKQHTNIKQHRNRGDQLFELSESHQKSQASIKKASKGTGVKLLKKCFCTFKLWKKQETDKNKNRVASPQNQSDKPLKVYTIGRVTTGNNKYIPQPTNITLMKNDSCDTKKLITTKDIEIRISNMNRTCDIETLRNTELSTMNNSSTSSLINPNFLNSKYSLMYMRSLNRMLYHNKSKESFRLNYALIDQSTKFIKSSNILKDNTKYTSSFINHKLYPKSRPKKVINDLTTLKHTDHGIRASPYSTKSFYAMNIQITGREKPTMNKLEPYECEPGVCKPYECDPLRCRELINKRLMKPVFTTSGTETNFKSTSSLTSQTIPSAIKAKKLQSSKVKGNNKKVSEHRQAVRVGSNFSFNIEFSKSKKDGQRSEHNSPKNYHKSHKNSNRIRSQIQQQIGKQRSKQITTQYSTRDNESQSEHMKTEHKASNAIPLLKRCFCTLKLKKHREEKSIMSTETQTLMYPILKNDIVKLRNMDSVQSKKPPKNHKNTDVIKPYECTPGICIPNQCDPYQCLKLIKKRKYRTKNVGVKSIRSRNISNSTMTSTQRTKMCDKQIENNTLESIRNSNKSRKIILNTKPVRQAVRIGSNFSFNVEFFKDCSGTSRNTKGKSKTANNFKTPSMKKAKDIQGHKKYLNKSKESFSQNDKLVFNIGSQTDFPQKIKSTMTNSFIKRCFCVANLRKEQNLNFALQKKNLDVGEKTYPLKTSSFLERCFCILKSITTVKEKTKNVPNAPAVSSQTESTVGLFNDITRSQKLAPYECEPGICTPGLCDPYVCDRVIKNRKALGVTKISNTEKYRIRSVSSSVKTPRIVKDRRTQFNKQKAHKQRDQRPSRASHLKKKRCTKEDSEITPGRQAVRIGSNFSLGVEFYKIKGMGKTDKTDSVLTTDYKYNNNSKTKSNGKIKKTQNKGTYDLKPVAYNQESQIHAMKMDSKASGVSHLLKRCFCTLALQKQSLRKISSQLLTPNNGAPVIKRTPQIRNKNIMTLNQNVSHKLKPYECEPNICIPGTCDPSECENRIKRRLQKESSTLTDKYKTKSASSLVSKPLKKESTKVQSKFKNNKDYEHLKHYKETKLKVPRKSAIKKINNSSKQAVKICSNFSFDVEFFKDKSHDRAIKISKLPKKQHRSDKLVLSNVANITPQSVSYKHKHSQGIKRMRNIDSQVVVQNVRSTMTGVTPFLKRCFCTLKLQKREVKSPPVTRNTIAIDSDVKEIFDWSPKIVTSNKTTHTTNKDIVYAPFMNLGPYECEPGVCLPGKCNPYECLKKINTRGKKMAAKSFITEKPQHFSKYSSAGIGAKTKKSQAFSVEQKHRERRIKRKSSGFATHPSNQHQAVRVASSFSFNVEFFKDHKSPDARDIVNKQKFSVKNKEHSESICKQKIKNMSSGNEGINFRHRQSQINRARTESKGSGMGPLLKRCFCTLKLQKLGRNSKLKPSTEKIIPTSKSTHTDTGNIIRLRDISHKSKNLEPYECEPGTCTPGFCDPYECERRIKKHQMRDLGTVTKRSNLKSTASITTRNNKMKSTKSQKRTVKKDYREIAAKKPPKKIKSHAIPSQAETSNRQAVRIGSSFSFNIEFYKDRLLKNTRSLPLTRKVKNSKQSKNIDTTSKKSRNSKTLGTQDRHSSYGRGSQASVTFTESRGSGMPTKLKRCFCTLTLQKFSGIPIPNNQFNTISKPKLKPEEVSTQTKINHNKMEKYSCEPYECEPGICIPGECNPNECIKIMKRNAKRHSRTAGTQPKRSSQISISCSTYPNIIKSKRIQSGGRFKKKQTLKAKHNGKEFLNKPCLKNRQAVKIGSKFSFDMEFSKRSIPQEVFIEPKYGRKQYVARHEPIKMRINSKDATCSNSTCKVINSHSRKSQSEILKTENKASFAGNVLKRCFCTERLHNKPSIPRPKEITINTVKVPSIGQGFKQQQYYVYYQLKKTVKNVCPKRCTCTIPVKDFPKFTNTVGTRTKNKYLKFDPNPYVQTKYNSGARDTNQTDFREMETILPYTPNKFNKKPSKVIFENVNETKKSNSHKFHRTCTCNSDFDQNYRQQYKPNDIKRSGDSKKLNNKKNKPPLLKEKFDKLSTSSPLKIVVSRCKEKFVKQKCKTKENVSQNADQHTIKSKGVKRSYKGDNLKISKSERRSIDKNRNEPRISKSLKIPNYLNENESQIVSQQRTKKYSRFQQGDTNQNKTIPAVIKLCKTGESNDYKKYDCTECQKKYGNKLTKCESVLKSSKQRKKTVKFSGVTVKGADKTKKLTILNILMKKILCKCNVREDKENKQPEEIKKEKVKGKEVLPPKGKKSRKFTARKEYCAYCNVARYSNENESCNETRDRKLYIKDDENTAINKNNFKSTQELIEDIKSGKEITFPLVISDCSQSKGKPKSLESSKQRKDEFKSSIKKSKGLKLHEVGKQVKGQYNKDSKGKHALKKKLKSGAKIAVTAKAIKQNKLCECRASLDKEKEAKILAKKKEGKICKCYPSVCECAKVVKIEKEREKKRKAFFKKQLKKAKMEKKRRRQLEKEKKAAGKRRRRDFFLRQKRYKIEDALRLHKRRDLDHYLEHRLRVKDTPDYLVATESLLDLAKLSCTVMEDIARSTYRAMIDPHHTYKRVEATVKRPSRIWPIVKTAIINSGAPATFKRIILRCKTMSSVKKIRARLERNRCTHYLLHIADRDPRKRMKIKKAQERLKRQRVPLDFQCSLYMASLRKKPYLQVYFKCPWFYPHFINLLGVLRQLTDMLLFILAAIVWSPCILGMELCRAMMCCLLCTG